MPYQKCVLDGYSFKANPVVNKNQTKKAVGSVKTWGGGVRVDWGINTFDQTIEYAWPYLGLSTYASLHAKFIATGTKSFTDEYGVAYTVIVLEFEADQNTTGGGLWQNVKLVLGVV